MKKRIHAALATRLCVALLAAGGAVAATTSIASGQSAREVIENAIRAYEDRMQGVENYTVVQEAMGFPVTTYFEREMVDGHPVFVPKTVEGQEVGQGELSTPYESFRKLIDQAELKGTETVAGEATYAIHVPDLKPAMSGQDVSGGRQDFELRDGTFYLDTDDYVVRRMVMNGVQKQGGEEKPVTMTATLEDYRDVEGVLHPWTMQMSIEGYDTGMSEEDIENARQQMEQLDEQMEGMPAAQREMMEKMLKPQMERMRQMLATGAMNFTVTVRELEVNEGPPGES